MVGETAFFGASDLDSPPVSVLKAPPLALRQAPDQSGHAA
ncbi:hypothetical protein GL4_1625 [Methyloceanibacter caenitepidi]|uniref:Uncharacterized protein n=1 Tax=Methyloceanibacter caenitepidi TaxID=1384459 RepID=A0A0A8K2D2_9HYPH|nr:hypothetical protein GL4_1625 [Methyloceanibacter caenitepidi]